MKKSIWVLTLLLFSASLFAQTNAPVKLALISETDEVSPAADVLTATLSGNGKIQLLERDEIEKVYREQGMSEANRDDLKLGRLLGADGLLLLNVVRTRQATNLTARLIAVKPGVVLTDGSFPWPLKDTTQWAQSAATYLDSFLPKLTVLAKDAIPISVVNLRAAIQSGEEQEAERELKLLTIQRLSQERQFFVLERQKMQLLGEEKTLSSDESAFWDGSYLLDGVVDQNGYSKDTITINGRLTPPKGGAPLLFEVSGNRTNLAEVVNKLADKVAELLNVNSTVKEWKAADEAQQYFDEAKWALKWGVFQEAEAAADSSWALGKKDLDCAVVRVNSYLSELSADVGKLEESESSFGPFYDANGVPLGPPASEADVQSDIKEMQARHPFGLTFRETHTEYEKTVDYVFANAPPDPRNIDRAFRALDLYYEFSQNSPEGLLKVASESSNWKNSEWYDLGIEDLVAASKVLRDFNLDPEAQKPVADKLAELRALARSVANWIAQSPSVHDSYFVGSRLATHDELASAIGENPNIFRCEVNWGCYWQERPEDDIALYRQLMSSPVFSYIHDDFWLRESQTPRLVAWDQEDRQRIPLLWSDFLNELNASTNALLHLEVEALELADASSETKLATAFTNLFNGVFENKAALIDNNVEVLYLDWGLGDLVDAKTGNGVVTDTKDSLNHLYHAEHSPRLEAMDQEFWNKTVPAAKLAPVFEKQKQYLREDTPYDFFKFVDLFQSVNYSQSQALEILPLVIAYKSNLVAQSQNASGMQKGQLIGAIAQVGFLEDDVNRILTRPAPHPQSQPAVQAPHPVAVRKAVVTAPSAAGAPEFVTNIMSVSHFWAIPLDRLQGDQVSNVKITAHHWFEGKLLLNFEYDANVYTFDRNGNWTSTRRPTFAAIAILDPATESWNVVACSEANIVSQNNFYHRSVLLNGDLFNCDGGQIRKYDFINQQWEVLKISDGNNYELFAANGHLYAANGNVIFEIIDGGNGTRILASARRRPPVTVLDTQDWGTPTLFAGPDRSLRVVAGGKFYTWTGNNWRKDSAAPPASFQPELIPDGVLFRHTSFNWPDQISSLSYLSKQTNVPELCLQQRYRADYGGHFLPDDSHAPLWRMPPNLSFANLPAAACQSGLYLLMDHSELQEIGNDQHELVQEKVVAKDGYNATLLCFSRGLSVPQKLFLNFNAPDGCPPAAGIDPNPHDVSFAPQPAWMLATTNLLFFGLENRRNSIPAFNQADRIGVGYQAGIWLLPVSRIEPAIVAQKQIQLDQMVRDKRAAEKAREDLLAKYDRNHNGVIDPEEKETALDDPAFIEFELDEIDTNHNGLLAPEELAWFDANTNNILDPKEQVGIDIAQHLLAQRLLKKFDANGDGVLDRSEFNDLWQSSLEAGSRQMLGFPAPFPDTNHDGTVDLKELEAFLQRQTLEKLQTRQMPGRSPFFNPMGTDHSINQQKLFKTSVESFWRNPGSATNRPSFRNRIPSSTAAVSNRPTNISQRINP